MIGMNAATGRQLSGFEHLRQSVRDILTTPLGSRVMGRDYGSRLFELVDAPLNGATLTRMYAATYQALKRWEPRLLVEQVGAVVKGGGVELTISGEYQGQKLSLGVAL